MSRVLEFVPCTTSKHDGTSRCRPADSGQSLETLRRSLIYIFLQEVKPSQRSSDGAARLRSVHTCAAISQKSEANAHIQLATALLPKDVDVDTFSDKLYQWAATVTSSGRNMPLALPMRVNRSPKGRGFEMSFLRMRDRTPVSVADITATVEEVAGKGQVLFVRLYDAEGSDLAVGQHKDAASRVQALSRALVDIPTVMNSMPPAIKLAVVQSRN